MILFDRDGTLNVRRPSHVADVDDLELLPDAERAVAAAAVLGRVVIVTNQQSVGRGEITAGQLEKIHAELVDRLARTPGARIDAIYVCPHLAGTCDCRKPAPGLFLRALADAPDVDPRWCAVIGDHPSDLHPGLALGMRAFHVVGDPADPTPSPDGAVRVGSAWEAATMLSRLPGWSS
jgi:D-glycero-D-manno-heptose 1,7-bisphosphate phosphatase